MERGEFSEDYCLQSAALLVLQAALRELRKLGPNNSVSGENRHRADDHSVPLVLLAPHNARAFRRAVSE